MHESIERGCDAVDCDIRKGEPHNTGEVTVLKGRAPFLGDRNKMRLWHYMPTEIEFVLRCQVIDL